MKKSLRDISWRVEEPIYRADRSISYSNIKTFAKEGFSSVDHIYESKEPSPEMKFGTLVDCLITNSSNFNNIYVIADIPETPKTMIPVLATIMDNPATAGKVNFNDVEDSVILQALTDTGVYQNNWSPTTKVNTVRKALTEIYNANMAAIGKEVITSSTYEKAVNCKNALLDAFPTIFNQSEDPEEETLFQLKFKANYLGVQLRCMPDIIKVNHLQKRVKIYDLKTCHYPEYEFYRALIQHRYDIQAEEYYWNVRYNMDNDDYFKDFTLEDFEFVVVNPDKPMPLKWIWERDKTSPDGSYGSQHMVRLKKWNDLARELWKYLTGMQALPEGISPVSSNSLITAINNTYL